MLKYIKIPVILAGLVLVMCLGGDGIKFTRGSVDMATMRDYSSSRIEKVHIEAATVEPLITNDDLDLMARVVMAEAGGESELGIRMVIDVILNRVDDQRFPNTISGVIYAKNQFACIPNGAAARCYAREDICKLIREELVNRTNNDVLFFRTKHFHTFGTPLFQVGNHWFSK